MSISHGDRMLWKLKHHGVLGLYQGAASIFMEKPLCNFFSDPALMLMRQGGAGVTAYLR